MSATDHDGQLELLPAAMPEVQACAVNLSDLTGYEHARPDRELVELIARMGLLQPVVVTGGRQTGYQVIEGRRRAKAIAELAAAGRWRSPPKLGVLIVKGGSDYQDRVLAGIALALHATRSPSPGSELAAIEAILAEGGETAATVKRIAEQTGMRQQTVRRRLKLRNLSPTLRSAFDHGEMTASVAEAAARLNGEQQAAVARVVEARERVTLATVREIARERTATAAAQLPSGLFADGETPWLVAVRGHLRSALDAVPAGDQEGQLRRAIATALERAEDTQPKEAA